MTTTNRFTALRMGCESIRKRQPMYVRHVTEGDTFTATVILNFQGAISGWDVTQMQSTLARELRAEPWPIDTTVEVHWELNLLHRVHTPVIKVTCPAAQADLLKYKLFELMSPVYAQGAKVQIRSVLDANDDVMGLTLTSTTMESAVLLRDMYKALGRFEDYRELLEDNNVRLVTTTTQPRPGGLFATTVQIDFFEPMEVPWAAVQRASAISRLYLDITSIS